MKFKNAVKVIFAIVIIGVLLCIPVWNFAYASATPKSMILADNNSGNISASKSYPGEGVLGSTFDINSDGDAEELLSNFDSLLAIDQNNGALIFDKNADGIVQISGGIVQLMTVQVALDYLSLNEMITITEQQMQNVPKMKGNLGLAARNTIVVEDLIASMLLNGSTDAAFIITDEIMKKAATQSFGSLMVQKAEQLGMTATDYSNCDGTGLSNVDTTAIDQYKLYINLLKNEELSPIFTKGKYIVQSRSEHKNVNIAEKINNNVAAMIPGNNYFDSRMKAASSCSVDASKSSYVYCFHAQEEKRDVVFIFRTEKASTSLRLGLFKRLIDVLSNLEVVDLCPYIETQLSELVIHKDAEDIDNWSLFDKNGIYGRLWLDQLHGEADSALQNLATMKVALQPDESSFLLNGDGHAEITASIKVEDTEIGKVGLVTTAIIAKTETENSDAGTSAEETKIDDNVTPTAEPILELYSDDDVKEAPTSIMGQHGWAIIVGVFGIGSIIIIAVVGSIKNKMEL